MNSWHQQYRHIVADVLAQGWSYETLAQILNDEGFIPPRANEWTKDAAYNLARQLGLKSIRQCRSQPRASRTARVENARRVVNAMRRAMLAGSISTDELKEAPLRELAQRIEVSEWLCEKYRHVALIFLGIVPRPVRH